MKVNWKSNRLPPFTVVLFASFTSMITPTMLPHLSASRIVHTISRTITSRANAQGQMQIQETDATSADTAQMALPLQTMPRQRFLLQKMISNTPILPPQRSAQLPLAPLDLTARRREQGVLSKTQEYKIARWMVGQEEVPVIKIPSKEVLEFFHLFRRTANANEVCVLR